jgi:exopolysaccharide biosynthesis polyprenyl glycosylphosphotransferase
VAGWADVEFRKTARRRRLHDAVSLAPEILILWDFLVSLVCGQAMRGVWYTAYPATGIVHSGTATFLPGLVIGSMLLALCLRQPARATQSLAQSISMFSAGAQRRLALASAALAVFLLAPRSDHLAGEFWIAAWLLLFAAVAATSRRVVGRYLGALEKRGAFREAVAIVGMPATRDRLVERFALQAQIVGFCEAPLDRSGFLPQAEIAKLQELSADGRLDSVVLALEKEQTEADISGLVERLKVLPMQVGICEEGEYKGADPNDLRLLAVVPIKILADRPINQRDLLIKTTLDKAGAATLIVLLAPLMAGIAIAIAATSKGPVIFRQTRQGWCGRQFTMFKFRTMRDVPHAGHGYAQTKRKDPRCTRVGRFLRSTSMDELPQLWNVIRGDMSFVGPRPHAEMLDQKDRAAREIVAEYAQRFRVKPGITGWAQIHGARGAISTVEQLRRRVMLDLFYIENWSLWLDLKIMALTPFCMMGKNVF